MQKLPLGFMIVVSLTVLLGVGLLAFLAPTVPWEAWPALSIFFLLIILAMSFPIQAPTGVTISSVTTLYFSVIFVFGPGAGLLTSGLGAIVAFILTRRWPLWRILFNGAQLGLSVALAGFTFQALGGKVGSPPSVQQIPAIIATVLAFYVANNLFIAAFRSSLRRTRFPATLMAEMLELDILWDNLLTVPLSVLLVILYTQVHPLSLVVFLISLPFQRQARRLYFERQRLYAEAIEALVIATDVNFPQAQGHSRRVADLSVAIAREMSLSDPEVEAVQFAALLHDVGMIGLDDLLENPADLSREDQSRLKDHVLMGAEITRELPRKDIAKMVLGHHEHYDGTGYPQGLQGKEIPLGARIISVAEAYESMVSGYLPYQDKHPPKEALRFIANQAGSVFDPEVVQAFIRASQNGAIPWIESAPSPHPPPIEGEEGSLPQPSPFSSSPLMGEDADPLISSPLMGEDTGGGDGEVTEIGRERRSHP